MKVRFAFERCAPNFGMTTYDNRVATLMLSPMIIYDYDMCYNLYMLKQPSRLSLLLILTIMGCGGIQARPDAVVGEMPSQGPVGRTMKANTEKFATCGRDSVTIQTGSPQRMQLNFLVDAEGHVQKPEIANMSAPDPDLYDCVRRALKRIQFPAPKDRKAKKVTYPLVLKPEE